MLEENISDIKRTIWDIYNKFDLRFERIVNQNSIIIELLSERNSNEKFGRTDKK